VRMRSTEKRPAPLPRQRHPTSSSTRDDDGVHEVLPAGRLTRPMIRCDASTNGTSYGGFGHWNRNWKPSASDGGRWPTTSGRCVPGVLRLETEIILLKAEGSHLD